MVAQLTDVTVRKTPCGGCTETDVAQTPVQCPDYGIVVDWKRCESCVATRVHFKIRRNGDSNASKEEPVPSSGVCAFPPMNPAFERV